jgi:hypothetical protein
MSASNLMKLLLAAGAGGICEGCESEDCPTHPAPADEDRPIEDGVEPGSFHGGNEYPEEGFVNKAFEGLEEGAPAAVADVLDDQVTDPAA